MQILLKNAAPVEVEALVRSVPQQREVVRGYWNHQAVYAKKFIGSRAKKHFERDLAGVGLLDQAAIVTPALLHKGALADSHGFVAVFAAICSSKNAEMAYAELDEERRFALMLQLTKTLAQHHRAGLIQTDLYLKNFLVDSQSDIIYTLDGDGIRRLCLLYPKRQRLQNLATLFSKMDVQDDFSWSQDLYRLYCQEMGESFVADAHRALLLHTQKIRAKVCRDYADKKVFRNCTDVKVIKDSEHITMTARDFSVERGVLYALDTYLGRPEQNIKNGNTCTIAKAIVAGQDVVIKRYNIKGFLHGVNRALRQSRAAASWANAHRLSMLNMATPKPLALVEERLMGLFRRRAYFVSAFVDAPDIAEFFARTTDAEVRQQVAGKMATMFYRMYLLRISHGDCKASNIKIKDGRPILLDLDAMQAGAIFFNHKHIKDLKRFMHNWRHDAALAALFKEAFVSVYHGTNHLPMPSILARAGIV